MAAKAITAGLVLEQLNGQHVLLRLVLLGALFILVRTIDRTDISILAIAITCAAPCLVVRRQLQDFK
jgi:hypothetical protein